MLYGKVALKREINREKVNAERVTRDKRDGGAGMELQMGSRAA